ncbi:MAG: YqeG family HAD IIIA-type phosphatase [Candidatus Bruticola sp.]
MIKDLLSPSFKVSSVADVDLVQLKELGIKGILLDFDNTLVKWNGTSLPNSVCRWVKKAKAAGFRLCIVSNAVTARLERVAKRLSIPFVPQALKPSTAGLRRALKRLSIERDEAIMVGDQLFTDILAGRCCGMHTALIRPQHVYEQRWMKAVRCLENFVINRMLVKQQAD